MAKRKTSYKQAITEIEAIINKLENEELDVDELSGEVNRVATLIKLCKSKLHKTEEEVGKVFKDMEEKEG